VIRSRPSGSSFITRNSAFARLARNTSAPSAASAISPVAFTDTDATAMLRSLYNRTSFDSRQYVAPCHVDAKSAAVATSR
jgi:hypothetical protein